VKRSLVVALIGILCSVTALAQAERNRTIKTQPPVPPSYKLKPDVSFLGMTLEAAGGNAIGALPFDLPYESLSRAQQAQVKAAYESMGEGDEPPFPLGGQGAIYDPLTRGQQRLLIEGQFVAQVDVNSNGEPVSVAVVKTPDERFAKFAAGIALLIKYKPAQCSGVPCAMAFPIRLTLKVE
jgi:hypothetical protein